MSKPTHYFEAKQGTVRIVPRDDLGLGLKGPLHPGYDWYNLETDVWGVQYFRHSHYLGQAEFDAVTETLFFTEVNNEDS